MQSLKLNCTQTKWVFCFLWLCTSRKESQNKLDKADRTRPTLPNYIQWPLFWREQSIVLINKMKLHTILKAEPYTNTVYIGFCVSCQKTPALLSITMNGWKYLHWIRDMFTCGRNASLYVTWSVVCISARAPPKAWTKRHRLNLPRQ
jgi:hypothetical protein